MNKNTIPSNISNLSQLLDDGLILCDRNGIVISSNAITQNFLSKKILNKNMSLKILKKVILKVI